MTEAKDHVVIVKHNPASDEWPWDEYRPDCAVCGLLSYWQTEQQAEREAGRHRENAEGVYRRRSPAAPRLR